MFQVALVFLWLAWGLFMADLGLICMMVLQDYLQYEKQNEGKSREAGKQVSTAAQKLEKEESKKTESREAKKLEEKESMEAAKRRSREAAQWRSKAAEKWKSREAKNYKSKKWGKAEKQNEENQRSRKTKITKRNAQNSHFKICLKPCQVMSPPSTSGPLCGTCSNIA